MTGLRLPALTAGDVERYHAAVIELADEARRTAAPMLERGLTTETKADATLVTDVDRAIERRLREMIGRWFPDHGIVGEEYPPERAASAFQWILDPIDGTEELVHGIPTWGAMLALHHRGVPVVGLIDHPALDLRVSAGVGLGAYRNGHRLRLPAAPARARPEDVRLVLSARLNFTRGGRRGPPLRRHHATVPESPDLSRRLCAHRRNHRRRGRDGGRAQPDLGPGAEPGPDRGGGGRLFGRQGLRSAGGSAPHRRVWPAAGRRSARQRVLGEIVRVAARHPDDV